ncbi:PEP-CTERM sorting domain-containing protein [Oxalobacteraceae bacterium]|nr:PEP-CTERM sorting domain-containing protein [Oxalobacteraceae bacterium]
MKFNITLASIALSALFAGQAQANGFVNGAFESGNANGWTVGEGYRGDNDNASLSPSQFLPGGALYGGGESRSGIVTLGDIDPIIGAALGNTVYSGNYSYRAEDVYTGGYASAVSQKVSNYTDKDIFFAWKAVLENGGHENNGSAALFITLHDDTTNENLISRFYNAGTDGGGVDSRFSTKDNYFYTGDWQIEQLAIGADRLGHDFTLSLLAADCYYTAHTGYAYLDGFGNVAPPIPEPTTYGMMLGGLGLLALAKRRKDKQAK